MYQSETDSRMQLCHWSGEYMRVAPINIVDTLFHSALSVERSYEFDTYKFSSLRALSRILLYIYNLVIVHTLTLTHRLTHSFTHSLDLFHSIFYSNLWVCFSFVSVFIIIQCFFISSSRYISFDPFCIDIKEKKTKNQCICIWWTCNKKETKKKSKWNRRKTVCVNKHQRRCWNGMCMKMFSRFGIQCAKSGFYRRIEIQR